MDSLYSRLLAGETADDIAKAFADELNAAQRAYEEEQARQLALAAEEEARKAAEEAARETEAAAIEARVNDLTTLLLDALKYLRTHYPDVVDEEIRDNDDVEVLARLFVMLLDSSSTKVDWGFAALPNLKWLF